ncbi:hypothetical protein [Bartonella sp. AA74HLJMH]|uniref:hypothetical protein n=1 Tax=Bartonella sp. AA74HLJMH TaxID=3243436 RepID=UPI0035CF960A
MKNKYKLSGDLLKKSPLNETFWPFWAKKRKIHPRKASALLSVKGKKRRKLRLLTALQNTGKENEKSCKEINGTVGGI